MIEIAFAVDKFTELCAFVAIHSMLKNSSRHVSIIILHEDREPRPGDRWEEKLKSQGFDFSIRYQQVDASVFRKCKSLYNSYTNYLRIYAPKYAQSSRIIYSDVDVVFTTDVACLDALDLEGAIIARNGGSPCKTRSLQEQQALYACGREEQDLYYGSGLAVIDVEAYNSSNKAELCEDIATKYAAHLKFQEQTVWNCVFSASESIGIDERWCQTPPLKKSDSQKNFDPGIIHFAGSPKPWDLIGEYFHPAYSTWIAEAQDAGIKFHAFAKYFQGDNWKRALRIKKQYKVWF